MLDSIANPGIPMTAVNFTKTTASAKAYAKAAVARDELIARIEAATAGRDCREMNWAQVGHMAHVNDLLRQAAEFLEGSSK